MAAASSLTEALPAATKAAGQSEAEWRFGATSRLAAQLKEGLKADLFVSADAKWMDELVTAGLVEGSSRVDLVGNSLVAVVPAGSPVVGLEALAAAPRWALAGPEVPAGRYAEAALSHGGLWAQVSPRVVRAEDVRGALRWVADGEADVAVVYATDAAAEPKVAVAWTFPPESHPPIVYPAAVVAGCDQPEAARALLAAWRGPEAQAALRSAGFTTPGP